jgi:hypothetical protein
MSRYTNAIAIAAVLALGTMSAPVLHAQQNATRPGQDVAGQSGMMGQGMIGNGMMNEGMMRNGQGMMGSSGMMGQGMMGQGMMGRSQPPNSQYRHRSGHHHYTGRRVNSGAMQP